MKSRRGFFIFSLSIQIGLLKVLFGAVLHPLGAVETSYAEISDFHCQLYRFCLDCSGRYA